MDTGRRHHERSVGKLTGGLFNVLKGEQGKKLGWATPVFHCFKHCMYILYCS